MTMSLQSAARLALACLDLTSLNDDDTPAAVQALAARAAAAPAAPAALCVWPRFVAVARAAAPAGVKIAAVANFPEGALDLGRALADTRAIVEAGADEVDLVLPWRTLRDGDTAGPAALVRTVRAACPDRVLKLIIESGELAEPGLIRAASWLGLESGVDFLKTSTGKTPTGATLAAAEVMLQAIADFGRAHPGGRVVGFKASGGIRTVADARAHAELAARVLGEAALVPQRLRFGASGLLSDIEAVLGGAASGADAGSSSRY